MHAVLLTLVALTVGNDAPPVYQQPGDCACGQCAGGASHKDVRRAMKATRNMMPQTCYEPVYGCYRGSRFIQRYPAFHGTYYRRPYNYRNMFDYPWHAEPHEPTSLFSFNLAEQQREAAPLPPAGVGDEPGPSPEPAPVQATSASVTRPIGAGVREATPIRTTRSARRNGGFRR